MSNNLNAYKAIELYYKLHKCLKISITAPTQPNGDELSCHTNRIICYLAKSIESGQKWYDVTVDVWCDYFIEQNKRNIGDKNATY